MSEPDVSDVGKIDRKTPAPTTKLTLALFRKRGYICDVSESYNAFAQIRKDLWKFCDIVAVNKNEVIFIQTTSKSNMSSRRKKIKANDAAMLLATIPSCKVLLLGWYKQGRLWQAKEEYINPEDF